MTEVQSKPPPGSAKPGTLRFGIGAVVIGLAAGIVGALGIAGVLDLSTDKQVGGVVVSVALMPLGVAAIVGWVKLRPRKGVPAKEWEPPKSPWQERLESSRAFTVLLVLAWVWFLIASIRAATLPMTADTVMSLVISVGFVLMSTSALLRRWRRGRATGQPESDRQD